MCVDLTFAAILQLFLAMTFLLTFWIKKIQKENIFILIVILIL